MKGVAVLAALLPLLARAEVRIVAPDWSGIRAPFIEEPVLVKVGVNGSGGPMIVESAEPLPDNVVRALEQSRFNDKKFNGKVAGLTIRVRRPLSEPGMRTLTPDWRTPENHSELRAAKDYSEKEVGRLEKKAQREPDKYVLGSLLSYYTLSQQVDPLLQSAAAKN